MSFVKDSLAHVVEGLINILTVWLPHQFAPGMLFKTLFYPWKGITAQSKEPGFSIKSMMDTFFANAISVSIGATLRGTLLFTFFALELFLVVLSPIIILLYCLLLPLTALAAALQGSPGKKREALMEQFVKAHALDPQYAPKAQEWFLEEYKKVEEKGQWWRAENMRKGKPFGYDWAYGFTNTLDNFSTPVAPPYFAVNREAEIDELQKHLISSHGTNCLLVGEEGVGRRTLIGILAGFLQTPNANPLIRYKRVLELEVERLLAQTTDHTAREIVLENVLIEAERGRNVILVINNIHRYIDPQDTNNITASLEKFAKSPSLSIIGITTPFHFQQTVSKQPAISEMFNRVDVKELSRPQILSVLKHQALILEGRYNQIIPYDTLEYVIDKSEFYFADKPFPGKGITLLEDICIEYNQKGKRTVIQPSDIDAIISAKAHVPTTLTEEVRQKLIHLNELLEASVVGQSEAINEVTAALQRSFMLLGKRKKPLASFLFLGPTGVGKTETAKAITMAMFGKETEPMRFDMSTYQNKEDIPKLIGDMATNTPGILTSAIAEHPFGVLLLDEIEKANHDLLNIFLTLLDEGYITDGFGKRVDAKNLIIVATSNAGVDYLYNPQNVGKLTTDAFMQYLIDAHIFAPEFLNRFDGVVAFKPINNDMALQIARKMLLVVSSNMQELHGITLQVSDAYLQAIINEHFNPTYGARNLEHAIRTNIESVVAKKFLEGSIKQGDTVML